MNLVVVVNAGGVFRHVGDNLEHVGDSTQTCVVTSLRGGDGAAAIESHFERLMPAAALGDDLPPVGVAAEGGEAEDGSDADSGRDTSSESEVPESSAKS